MLKINGISKRYKKFSLDEISLEVGMSGHYILLGPTGSGKSLLFNIITGVIKPDSGSLIFNGIDITTMPPEQRGFGVVYQDSALFPHLGVEENIAFPLRMRRVPAREAKQRVHAIMNKMSITHLMGRGTRNLSGGERQRTALARALITNPPLLLLDEPLSSLDYMTRREMIEVIRKIKSESGTTVFHITHDFEEAMSLADTAAVIRGGSIVQSGTVKNIFSRPSDIFTAAFTGAKNIYSGRIIQNHEGSFFMTDEGVNLYIGRPCPEDAKTAVLSAEEVILSKDKIETSARNIFHGTIKRVTFSRGVNEIEIDAGISITSYITGRSMSEMNLARGMKVFAAFKGSAVHIF